MYKLKQLWYRRIMWIWCFQCWYNPMFPHIVYPNYTEHPDIIGIDDAHWFWMHLNDFNGVYLEFDGSAEWLTDLTTLNASNIHTLSVIRHLGVVMKLTLELIIHKLLK